MVNCYHFGQGAAVVRIYPTLRIFIIGVTYSNAAINDVLRNGIVIFVGVFRAPPLLLIYLQVSDSLAVQDALGLVRAVEVEVSVVAHHPLLEILLVCCSCNDPVHFIDHGLLIHQDLETEDLNDPHRECILGVLCNVRCPQFGGRGHNDHPLCNMHLQLLVGDRLVGGFTP